MSVATIWLISLSLQVSFESIYTSSESPFFSLSNGIFKCSWLFFFRFFLWATMFVVEVSCCTPPDKLDLLRPVNNVEPGQMIPHSIALWKLYTRTLRNLKIFVGNRLLSGPDCSQDCKGCVFTTMHDRFSVEKRHFRRKETQIRNQHQKLSRSISHPKASDDFHFSRQLHPWYPSGIRPNMNPSANLLSLRLHRVFRFFSLFRSYHTIFDIKGTWSKRFHFWTYTWGVPRVRLSRKMKVVAGFWERDSPT